MDGWDQRRGRARAGLAGLCAALAVSVPASAAEPDRPRPAPEGATVSELTITASKMVSELTVTGKVRCLQPDKWSGHGGRPKLVAVFPARGSTVRPGLLVVRLTFDQPMACAGGLDASPPLVNPCPGAERQMLLSYDRRTVRTVCVVEPQTQYGFSLGVDPNAKTFTGLGGLPVEVAKIGFATSAGPPVADICEALSEDAETAAQLKRNGRSCEGRSDGAAAP